MKKIRSFLLGSAVLLTSASLAQTETEVAAPGGVRFGVKAGINIANLSVEPDDDEFTPSSLIGINGGLFATIPAGTGFAIQPELTYSGLGAKQKGSDSKIGLNYLTLPVLAKYSFEDAGFGAYIGPQIGYLLSAKAKSGGSSADLKDSFKSTDFSGIIGVEYFLPVGVGLSVRYQLGLSNIAEDTEDDESVKNRAVTFTLGYRF